jgi:hypothetical protein
LILRIRGALSIFAIEDREFIKDIIGEDDYGLINRVSAGLALIDEKISKSKWKEKK